MKQLVKALVILEESKGVLLDDRNNPVALILIGGES
jgi:hypothetical protein